ncbi:hypothetical protein PanWU01x14_071660 [Parasponia andersonii]|uniref:Proton pump-interactor n=1 Tax=Parasponia andersonii TaxID=3476 RepID=A0A2P5DEI8_PARAD|nr:hypothetical protein PanWU01x14_071660 [Parasponia andersonii]
MEELEANYFLEIQKQVDKFNVLGDIDIACASEQHGLQLHEPKCPKHESPNIKARIIEIEKLIKKLGQEKLEIAQKQQEIMFDRDKIKYGLWDLYHREAGIVYKMAQNWKKLDIFELFLDKLNLANKNDGEDMTKSRLSREELDKHKFHFRIRHGKNNSLANENKLFKLIKAGQQIDVVHSSREEEINDSSWVYRQIRCEKTHKKAPKDRIREIKRLEWYREETIAEAIVQGKIRSSVSSNRKAIRDQMKVLGDELEELRKKNRRVGEEIGSLRRELKAIENEKNCLRNKQWRDINQKKEEAHQCLLKLMKQQADQEPAIFLTFA